MKEEILKTSRTDLQQVDPRNITIEEGFNVRKDYGDIPGLAHSVVEMGVIEPLIGFKVRGEDRFVMTDGHRRLAAVVLAFKYHAEGKAGFEDISKIKRVAMRIESADAKERLFIMAVTGEKKKALTDLEKAEMYARLVEFGLTEGKKRGEVIADIVKRLGVSQATVYNILTINELPVEIKESIAKGEISGSTVVTIVREVKDVEAQKRLVSEAIAEAKSAPTAEGKEGKKATAKNVKGLKAKTAIQRLKELSAKLEEENVNNVRSRVLNDLIEGLEKKTSISKMVDLFVTS